MREKIANAIRRHNESETDWDEMLDELCDLHIVSECYSPEDRLDILVQERDELMKKEYSGGLMMEVGRKLGAMQEIERIFNIR